jgi:hypothetical protein
MYPWAIVAEVGIAIALHELQSWLATPPPDTRPRELQSKPNTNEGSPIPLIFGMDRVRQPILAWYGGFHVRDPIDFGGISETENASRYGVNMLFVCGFGQGPMGQPANNTRLRGIWVGDKKLELNMGHLDAIRTAPSFYGGQIQNPFDHLGLIQFFSGTATQQISGNAPGDQHNFTDLTQIASAMRRHAAQIQNPLDVIFPQNIPGYRNMVMVALSGDDGWLTRDQNQPDDDYWDAWFMWSANVPAFSFEIYTTRTRYDARWGQLNDADPAAAIYEILTHPLGRLNIDPLKIDDTSFGVASFTLLGENNGYSRVIDSQQSAKQVIQEICNQICGAFYEEPTTGKLTLKLIRNDYDPDTIPFFDDTHVVSVQEYTPGGWTDVVNQVRVKYVDRVLDYHDGTAMAQNTASAVFQDSTQQTDYGAAGKLRSVTLNYPGVRTNALASTIAARDLNLLSQPLSHIRLSLNRRPSLTTGDAKDLRPASVFKLTLPEYFITETVFRVTKIELGQLGDNTIVIDAVQDVFHHGTAVGNPVPPLAIAPQPLPLVDHKVQEAPWWLQNWKAQSGQINTPEYQYILGLAAPRDTTDRYAVVTQVSLFPGQPPSGPAVSDIPLVDVPMTATVETLYAKESAPYDTTVGLRLQGMQHGTISSLTSRTWTEQEIFVYGYGLIIVDDEIMGYESCTDLGGGVFRLNRVWRALMDTTPKVHVVGARAYFIGTANNGGNYVGTVGRAIGQEILAITRPKLANNVQIGAGGGGDVTDDITLRGRCIRPNRPADLAIGGKNIIGTTGIPADTNFRSASRVEEAVEVYAKRRTRNTIYLIRGDGGDEFSSEVNISYNVQLVKVGGTPVALVELDQLADTAIAGTTKYLLGKAGHGTIDIQIEAHRQLTDSIFLVAWDIPTVRMVCPTWRNLLANPRFEYNTLTNWTTAAGTPAIGNDAASVNGDTTGYYVKATTSTSPTTISQIVDIDGYLARGMTGKIVFYARNTNGDTNDTATVTIDPLDGNGTTLGGAVNNTAGPATTEWLRATATIAALPALVKKLKITIALNETATLGTTTPETIVSELELVVGQFNYDVLANSSFETASTASWTNSVNSFAADTIGKSPSANFVRGGAFATSAIFQEYTIPTGFEWGSKAVVRAWRSQNISLDTGRVTIEARDSGGGVLASDTTGLENLTLNRWVRRTLTCDVPEGTTKIRVTLDAVRTGGVGNSGAMFDEVVLSVHKDLDPRYETVVRWDVPKTQETPSTWQTWYDSYESLDIATIPIVFAGGDASRYGIGAPSIGLVYTGAKASGRALGLFALGVREVPAYVFTRQSGPTAVDLITAGEDQGLARIANWTSLQFFTVIVIFKIDETGLTTACGLTGRRNNLSGWGLQVNASGQVLAVLVGTGGTKTVHTTSTVHDGAWHLAAISYDSTGQILKVFDERGSVSVSTASGLGEIANTDLLTPFRIGRDKDTVDTIPGMIANVFVFDDLLSDADVLAHFTYGDDPNALLTTYTRDKATWTPVGLNGTDESLVVFAPDQVAIGYDSDLKTDGGTGLGLALGRSTTNQIPTFAFTDATKWQADAGVVLTQSVIDATGRARGVTVGSATTTAGLKVVGATFNATATARLMFFARASTGTPTLKVQLLNSIPTVIETQTVVLDGGTAWKLYVVSFSAWDNSSATAQVRFMSNSGTITFDLTHVMFLQQGTEVPYLWPEALATVSATSAVANLTLPKELNSEGELIAEGVASQATPPATGCICEISNATNGKNVREVNANTAAVPRFVHADSAPASNTSSGTAFDWSLIWNLRGRWNALKMLDNAVNPYAGIVTTASVNSAVYGRAATWTYDTTAGTRLRLGTGTNETTAVCHLLRSVTIRAREAKLV